MLSKSSSCFSSHNFLMNEKGDLYSFGTNTCGQLSTGDKKDRNNATFVLNNPKIKSMSTGHSHSFFLQLDGELYACGKNNHNQLGLDLNQDHPSFELVTTNVKRVDCSHHFSIIQKENGKIFWSGFWKSLKTSSAKFKKELEIKDVIHFSVGQDHALFLTRSGEVWSVGDCGLGEEAAVKPRLLLIDEKIFGLACSQHSFILTRDDNNKTMLRSFGDNTHGKLGIGFSDFANKNQIVTLTSFKRIKSVHVGADHSIILNEDGSVFGCGSNEKHMLGISEKKSSVYHFTKIPLANVTHVSTGLKHSMFVNENKEVYITRYMKNTKPFKKIDFVDLKLTETYEIYEWRKEIHKFFDQDFRSSVFFFLLCLKFKEQSFKITKWLKLNIIKLTY